MKIALVQPYHGCNHHPCIIAADGGLDDALVSACHRRIESQFRPICHVDDEVKGEGCGFEAHQAKRPGNNLPLVLGRAAPIQRHIFGRILGKVAFPSAVFRMLDQELSMT